MIARPLALFLGFFTLLNVIGQLRHDGFDMSLWWIDLGALPAWPANLLLSASAAAMALWALGPKMGPRRKAITVLLAAVLLFVAIGNAIQFYVLLGQGRLSTLFPIPLSLFIAAALGGMLRTMLRRRRALRGDSAEGPRQRRMRRWRSFAKGATVMLLCVVGFPVFQMLCFGKTDYRREADAIVVFGAGVYADGRPSDALVDRVRTGCALHKEFPSARLIFSGGPGQGAVSETQAMRALALKEGVPADAIGLDARGVNTQATVDNTAATMNARGLKRLLAVSHFYHLPRVKMCFARAGVEAYTVPARESYLLTYMPYYMAREVAAVWTYYFRPLTGR